jgi:hypothetical protein
VYGLGTWPDGGIWSGARVLEAPLLLAALARGGEVFAIVMG